MYKLIRPLLFSMDPERVHDLVIDRVGRNPTFWGTIAGRKYTGRAFSFPGIDPPLIFGGPVGLAAGMDKNAEAVPFWPHLGFGFMEVGTVTLKPQVGNPKPRMFRYPKDRAVINRMGFNSDGADTVAARLVRLKTTSLWPDIPVGVNIGLNKETNHEFAPREYALLAKQFRNCCDFLTINVSSPNTPGLRKLQNKQALGDILSAVRGLYPGPLFLKLSPDLSTKGIRTVVKAAERNGVHGIIAANTTVSRDHIGFVQEQGGLSGAPLWHTSKPFIASVLAETNLPVIGVGGIMSSDNAHELLDMGCKAVQILTGLVFEGPGLVRRINRRF